MTYFIGFLFGMLFGAIPFAILWLLAEKSVKFWRQRYMDTHAFFINHIESEANTT